MFGRGRGQRGKLREWSAWGGGGGGGGRGGGGGGGEGEEAEGRRRRKRWRKGSEGKNGTREYDIIHKCACTMKRWVKVCSATQHFGQRYVYCQNCTKTH